ncbi:MAG: DUF3784 domain-containing protein [Oscillospiraceae bacterium]|nr:DUF3784 domain-containing protein [Oscillospiraceae bacterium]
MIGKLIGSGVTALIGLLCIVLGYLIWKKERIDLLHAYHIEKVSPEDRKAFCALSGSGLLVIGSSLLLTAVLLWITESALSFLLFAAGLAAGMILLIVAGMKYHKSHL